MLREQRQAPAQAVLQGAQPRNRRAQAIAPPARPSPEPSAPRGVAPADGRQQAMNLMPYNYMECDASVVEVELYIST